jgi:HTH-type transcriptional regulator / antitoxin HigA
MTTIAPELKRQWKALAPYLTISNEQEYDAAVERLNALLDEVEDDESHPLYSLLDTLGILIEAYDNKHYPLPDCNGIDNLIYQK